MSGMDSLSDEDQDEVLTDRIEWAMQRWWKMGQLSEDEKIELVTTLAELCAVRQRRSERFAEAVDDGTLCAECPCAWIAELAGEECMAKQREEAHV